MTGAGVAMRVPFFVTIPLRSVVHVAHHTLRVLAAAISDLRGTAGALSIVADGYVSQDRPRDKQVRASIHHDASF